MTELYWTESMVIMVNELLTLTPKESPRLARDVCGRGFLGPAIMEPASPA